MNNFVIVFKNTHDAIDTENKLKSKEINIRVMPTPTSITKSCGICVYINENEFNKVDELIKDNYISYKAIYLRSNEGFSLFREGSEA